MKHMQKDGKVQMCVPRESAQQNVVIVGELNDEDHAVPSVMKLSEKLTDEKVDEMILDTDVDETHCLQQLFDVPVPQIAEGIMEVVTTFHESESQNESLKVLEKITKYSQYLATSSERTDAKIVSRHDLAVNQ